eukprot:GFKZ01000908.1.p1 GENE.GFKZ01000908.1~~GFKZ01000908.1.p1  ORF type:complete len:143 (-),score=5.48 GFKZ01000908.1:592-1020(-)
MRRCVTPVIASLAFIGDLIVHLSKVTDLSVPTIPALRLGLQRDDSVLATSFGYFHSTPAAKNVVKFLSLIVTLSKLPTRHSLLNQRSTSPLAGPPALTLPLASPPAAADPTPSSQIPPLSTASSKIKSLAFVHFREQRPHEQ